ncbi:HEAT repeat domain-containing protein [bacterium]|nr:HEAT repeat domain-containing protein [bacterium]
MTATPESVKQLLESPDLGDRLRGVNQLRGLDPQVAFALIQPAITDPNARVRYAAVSQVSSLGRQDRDRALHLLRDRLHTDNEIDVKAAAADSIGALQLTEAMEDLQTLYRETNEWILQVSIVAALGEMRDDRAFDLLAEALNSREPLVQTAAIGALGEMGDKRAIALLVPLTAHPDWQIRYRLVQAFMRLGGEPAREALATLAQDELEQVAREARNALEVWSNFWSNFKIL